MKHQVYLPPNPVHEFRGRWFFWDETWSQREGPFDSELEANEYLGRYIVQLNWEGQKKEERLNWEDQKERECKSARKHRETLQRLSNYISLLMGAITGAFIWVFYKNEVTATIDAILHKLAGWMWI